MDGQIQLAPLLEEDLTAALYIEEDTAEGWNITALREELAAPAGRCFALRDGKELIGLALWQLAADEAGLLKISVKSARRQKGLGAFFLQGCIRRLQKEGARRFFLEVRCGNAPAIALYKKCGFQKAGIRRGFYKKPAEDALVMSREEG